jgi:uncharacterized protein (DUF362 family)
MKLNRRDFLKLGGTAAVAGLLAGCRCASSSPPVPDSDIRRPEIVRFWPDVPSKIVRARHSGAWTGTPQGVVEDNDLLVPEVLREMLDTAITELTGLDTAGEAWAALFNPDEQIAIKINTFGCGRGSTEVWTYIPLAMAVAQALQDAGIPAEQIVIFDRLAEELIGAGYTINQDDPGVRCYGTSRYTKGWRIANGNVGLSDILLGCHALINLPVLKAHGIGGLSFAMKSHYGTFDRPQDFHHAQIKRAIADLNALAPIQQRTRLIIGGALAAATTPRGSRPYWRMDAVGDSILMGFDPVAFDTIGLQMLAEMAKISGEHFPEASRLANPWLQNATELGLGTNDQSNINLVEVNLA